MKTNDNSASKLGADLNKSLHITQNKPAQPVNISLGLGNNKFKKQFENTLELAAKEAQST